ncbi:hypothetical protein GCM10029992_37830 [Glycomyces albus]
MGTMSEHLGALARTTGPFTIALHGVASFMPLAPVVFVPVVDGGRWCAALALAIRSGPVPVTQRFPFHPHITTAQRSDLGALERVWKSLIDFEATITVERFLLSMSSDAPTDPLATWQPVREYRLTGQPADAEPAPFVPVSASERTDL